MGQTMAKVRGSCMPFGQKLEPIMTLTERSAILPNVLRHL
jgi:hypothetical protein